MLCQSEVSILCSSNDSGLPSASLKEDDELHPQGTLTWESGDNKSVSPVRLSKLPYDYDADLQSQIHINFII